ncbi:hypothetical protein Pint_27810 [Pistacia integerrima]|uniref:Uncharacterized protein n=1 Tax=Pistacia integerrima TaxID=434235 RepID=A0ACC0YTT7_9ROSI|nr:hypothetical protein Pint_27810 [Pistacia integerrima]
MDQPNCLYPVGTRSPQGRLEYPRGRGPTIEPCLISELRSLMLGT